MFLRKIIMPKNSKKFYAVVRGLHPGIFQTWDECKICAAKLSFLQDFCNNIGCYFSYAFSYASSYAFSYASSYAFSYASSYAFSYASSYAFSYASSYVFSYTSSYASSYAPSCVFSYVSVFTRVLIQSAHRVNFVGDAVSS